MNDLLNAKEAAALLGYAEKTWVHRLAYHPDAPKPVQRGRGCKRSWLRDDILALREKWRG